MKKLLVMAISIAASAQVFAAELVLSGGESATILPNVSTRVVCSAGQDPGVGHCEDARVAFEKTMSYCYKNLAGSDCAKKHWPKFLKSNPNCANAGLETCLQYCYKNLSGSDCAELCQ